MLLAEKDVIVYALVERMGVHRNASKLPGFGMRYSDFRSEYYHMAPSI
jgi:hypothetical protein